MRIGKPFEAITTALAGVGVARQGDAKGLGKSDGASARSSDKRAEAKAPTRDGGPSKSRGAEKLREMDRSTERSRERREHAPEQKKDAGHRDGSDQKARAAERMEAARAKVEHSKQQKELDKYNRKEATRNSFKKAEYFFNIEERRRKREAAGKSSAG